jgi:hypothetical protein
MLTCRTKSRRLGSCSIIHPVRTPDKGKAFEKSWMTVEWDRRAADFAAWLW